MAKVFAAPIDAPEIDYSGDWRKQEDEYVAKLAALARKQATGKLVGEVVRFPIADGHASYMVWHEKPLKLVHLALGDGYQIPDAHSRGLRHADIATKVAQQKSLTAMFAEKKEDKP